MKVIDMSEMGEELGWVLARVLASWRTFRQTHDLESPNLKCCERSLALFDALREYEKLVFKDKS
jgi:hypothetical protein